MVRADGVAPAANTADDDEVRTLDDLSIREMRSGTRALDAAAQRVQKAAAREGSGIKAAMASAAAMLPNLPMYLSTTAQHYLFKREAEKKVVSKGEKGEVRDFRFIDCARIE